MRNMSNNEEGLEKSIPKYLEKINEIINRVPVISEIRKNFYQKILKMRYEKILKYSYENLCQ